MDAIGASVVQPNLGKVDPYARQLAQIAANVRAVREASGLSQVRFAQLADIDTTTLNRIENGRSDPTARTLLKIARASGVPASELMQGL